MRVPRGMFILERPAMPDYIELTDVQINKLIKELNVEATLNSGASLAHPNNFPTTFVDLNIKKRYSKRNTLLGTITSKLPNQKDNFIIGVTYEDREDVTPNEDFFEVQIAQKKLVKYKPAEFEKKYPEYKGMHWGMKDIFYT